MERHKPAEHESQRRRRAPSRQRRVGRSVGLAGWLLMMVAGCQTGQPPTIVTSEVGRAQDEAPEPPGEAALERAPSQRGVTPTLASQMRWHSRVGQRLLDAAIAGDLNGLREQAAAVSADEWSPALKPAWRAHHDAVREAAGGLQNATNGASAATALARLGVACGSCHHAEPEPPAVPISEPPPDAVMPQHRWAAERLWLGLSMPSDASWQQGARVFAAAPAVRSDSEPVDQLARQLTELARSAELAAPDGRPAIFARILSTCGQCHRDLGLK